MADCCKLQVWYIPFGVSAFSRLVTDGGQLVADSSGRAQSAIPW